MSPLFAWRFGACFAALRLCFICGLLATLAASAAAQAPAARKLKHDPFDWSALQQAIEKKPDAALPAAVISPPSPPPAPLLRAVMRGPSGTRVNLEGTILGVGESMDGYRLLEVREYSAVFDRSGANIEIEVGRRPPQ